MAEGREQTTAEKTKDIINDEMKPWEQHGGVISIPRFDYNAPSSLLSHSHSGFLITCTIKREKSATKEAMSILGKYLGSCTICSDERLNDSDKNSSPKRRKTCGEEDVDGKQVMDNRSKDGSDNSKYKSGDCLSITPRDTTADINSNLSLVKLTRSGLVLFTLNRDTSVDTSCVVSDIIGSLESEGSASPQWCHRILPFQATCSLNDKELGKIVSKLVLEFINDKRNTLSRPLKFAVGYNRRGFEETATKIPKDTSNASKALSLLDRKSCFAIVASAIKDVVPDSVVDLKSPELSVLVELLPVSGVPNGSFVVGVSVLPQSLVSTKPRLCVKAMAPSVKGRSGKHLTLGA